MWTHSVFGMTLKRMLRYLTVSRVRFFQNGVRAGPWAFLRPEVFTAEPPWMLQRLGDALSENRKKKNDLKNHQMTHLFLQHLLSNPLRNRFAVQFNRNYWFLSTVSVDFFSRKPRGVKSKRIRQKERLVRYETPPSAAGGGTPGENMRGERGQTRTSRLNKT